MNRFQQLTNGLILWRRMGHGLWPIRYWPDAVIRNYVLTLQQLSDARFPDEEINVVTGQDLIQLIRQVLHLLPPGDQGFTDDPAALLETILFALLAMVYPEEPGDLTIEELLAGQ